MRILSKVSIRSKIISAGIIIFCIFMILSIFNLKTHREIINNIDERYAANERLSQIEEFARWKNTLIRFINDSVAAESVQGSIEDVFRLPSQSMEEWSAPLVNSGMMLIELVMEQSQIYDMTESEFALLHADVNKIYDDLDSEIATVLARAQMNHVLGFDNTDENFLSPYVLKSLNQLTLVALNSLLAMNFSEENRGIVEKHRQFLSFQLSILDTEGNIGPLFDELFEKILAIDNFIAESNTKYARIEKQIRTASEVFNKAVQKNETDSIINKTRDDIENAIMTLKTSSRRSVVTALILMFLGPLLLIFLGIFGLNTLILKPIAELKEVMKRIETGKFDLTVPINKNDEIGALGHAFNVMTSVIKEKVTELRKARSYISNIINSMPSVLIGVDQMGTITQWNNRAEEITGITTEHAVGHNLDELSLVFSFNKENVLKSIRSKSIEVKTKQQRVENGEIIFEDITVYPLIANGAEGAVIRIDDVTEKVRIDELMIQSEKMLSVGGLAAGMAHEINNPLAGVLQTINVMDSRLRIDSGIEANRVAAQDAGTTIESIEMYMNSRGILRMIETIRISAKRIALIVRNMLSFARKDDSAHSSYQIEELFDKTLELAVTDYDLKKSYDFKKIEIVKEYTDNRHIVNCESSKLQQVFLNILRNGAQAMHYSNTEHPRFIIRTEYDSEKKTVVLQIEDNGPGMEERVRKRIFEPFFTTKKPGVGTGLGLSVSYFIITETHRGKMTVKSQPGYGTTFIISLPVGEANGK